MLEKFQIENSYSTKTSYILVGKLDGKPAVVKIKYIPDAKILEKKHEFLSNNIYHSAVIEKDCQFTYELFCPAVFDQPRNKVINYEINKYAEDCWRDKVVEKDKAISSYTSGGNSISVDAADDSEITLLHTEDLYHIYKVGSESYEAHLEDGNSIYEKNISRLEKTKNMILDFIDKKRLYQNSDMYVLYVNLKDKYRIYIDSITALKYKRMDGCLVYVEEFINNTKKYPEYYLKNVNIIEEY